MRQKKVAQKLDEATIERMRACVTEEFPLCLKNTLNELLGPTGREALDSIIRESGFQKPNVITPKDVWALYQSYVKMSARKLGESTTDVIGIASVRKMEEMNCQLCPIYEGEKSAYHRRGLA